MSIQDDLFDLDNFFEEYVKNTGNNCPSLAWHNIREWALDLEQDNEKLRPIVNGMRHAIQAMFDESNENDSNTD